MSTCGRCGASLPIGASFCPSCGQATDVAGSDERRIVTILFADIVGSTSMAEGLDPEDWKAVRDAALDTYAAVIDRHGGRVAQLLGDGLLAFFGAPVAHEDDPLRAIRAGLDIVDRGHGADRAAGAHPTQAPTGGIAVRVGITTGEVVVGSVGAARHGEYLATGDAVNVAARLQAEARPMSVLVSGETHDLAASAIRSTHRGRLTLKGRSAPVDAWEVEAFASEPRIARRRLRSGTFVGRAGDLSRLQSVSAGLRAGQGTVITITGEAGIGKTRLVAEWRASLAAEPSMWCEVGCETNGHAIPFRLASDCVRTLLAHGFADEGHCLEDRTDGPGEPSHATNRGLSDDAARVSVRAAAARLPGFADAEAILARLLELPADPLDTQLAGLDGRALQERTRRVTRALVEHLARRTPLAIVLEDVHWIDPSSADLIGSWLRLVEACPLVLCLTSRQRLVGGATVLGAGLGAVSGHSRADIALGPLDETDQRRLVASLADTGGSQRDLPKAVLGRSGGNPLFLEEIVAMEPRSAVVGSGIGDAAIPRSLRSLLLERIDALPKSSRDLARVGSVIGSTFSSALAEAVSARTGFGLSPASSDVVAASEGILELAESTSSESMVTFRHALIRDAAYASLSRRDRQRLHLAVARELEMRSGPDERTGLLAATLAHHFARGRADDDAARYAMAAARRAEAVFANAEAIVLFEIGVASRRALLAAAREPADIASRRADLVEALDAKAHLVRHVGRYAEAEAIFREAFELVPPEPSVVRARWLRRLGHCASDRNDYGEEAACAEAAEAMLEAVRREDDPAWWREWIDLQGTRAESAYWLGRTDELEVRLASLAEPIRTHGTLRDEAELEGLIVEFLHRRDRYMPSDEVVAHARAGLDAHLHQGDRRDIAWAHFHLGFALLWNLQYAEAESECRAALAEAEHTGDTLLVARAVTYLSIALRRLRRVGEVRDLVGRVIDVSHSLDIEQYVAIGLANRSWARLEAGDPVGASEDADAAAAAWPAEPVYGFHWLNIWPGIAADIVLGRPDRALARCRELLDAEQQPLMEPVRAAVEDALACADGPRARVALERAVACARDADYL